MALSLYKHNQYGTLSYEQVDSNWSQIESDVNGLSSRLPLNNYSATTDPTVNDDVTQGYSVGSYWFNRTTDTLFVNTNANSGAANWVEQSSVAGSFGSGAYADVISSPTDTTAGRLLTVGAGGWLAPTGTDTPTITDFTENIRPGTYKASLAAATGGPDTAAFAASVLVQDSGVGQAFVVKRATTNPANARAWFGVRVASSGAVTWSEVYTNNTILGTVSQSGGVPTGALIERGSNANGEYVKFADGAMICQADAEVDVTSTSVQTFTHPSFFAGNRGQVAVSWSQLSGAPNAALYNANIRAVGSTGPSWFVRLDTAGTSSDPSSDAEKLSLVAIGRWF